MAGFDNQNRPGLPCCDDIEDVLLDKSGKVTGLVVAVGGVLGAGEKRSRSAAQAFLSDPVMVATGIQIIRAVGVKRLLPILAVGGLALGLMAGRNHVGTNERAPAE